MDGWPTEFLEKRGVQLAVEAAAFPNGSAQNKHLTRLSDELLDAIFQMEGPDADADAAANPWPTRTHPTAIEMFKGA